MNWIYQCCLRLNEIPLGCTYNTAYPQSLCRLTMMKRVYGHRKETGFTTVLTCSTVEPALKGYLQSTALHCADTNTLRLVLSEMDSCESNTGTAWVQLLTNTKTTETGWGPGTAMAPVGCGGLHGSKAPPKTNITIFKTFWDLSWQLNSPGGSYTKSWDCIQRRETVFQQ